jgi:hypothetical protein
MGNTFQSLSALKRSVTLLSSTNLMVLDRLDIGSGNTVTIPSTSSLEIRYYVPLLTTNLLGYAQITSNFTIGSSTDTLATGLSITITPPGNGRWIKVTFYTSLLYNTSSGTQTAKLWDGTVGTGAGAGTILQWASSVAAAANEGYATTLVWISQTPISNTRTYNISLNASANTAGIQAGATLPAFIMAEAV